MQKLKLFVMFLIVRNCLLGQPTVSSLTLDNVGTTTARGFWTTTGATPTTHRLRWGTSPGVYTKGTNYYSSSTTSVYLSVSGLPSGTTIYLCADSSSDSGGSWSSCSTASTTTLTSTNPPQYPVLPETFSSQYPDTTGYSIVTVAADCSDLQTLINTAVSNQSVSGTVIKLPVGTTCTGNYTTPTDPAVKAYATSDVNTGTDRITVVSHGWLSGQKLRMGKGGCLPGSSPGVPNAFCQSRGPLVMGRVYYVVNPTTDNFQLSASLGGPAIDLTDQGSGTNYMVPWPPAHNNEVIIRSAANDSELPPANTSILNPSTWSSVMPVMRVTGGTWNFTNVVFDPGVGAHHIRIMGIVITASDASANLVGSVDPRPTFGLLNLAPEDALGYITLDRVVVDGLGYPNRVYRPFIQWDGMYMSIMNSYFKEWNSWRPGVQGFTPSLLSQTVTVNPGVMTPRAYQSCTAVSPITFTRTGGVATLVSRAYIQIDCTPTLMVETGVTASCTGSMTDHLGVVKSCTVVTSASPSWPVDGFGGFAVVPVAEVSATAGVWSSVVSPYGAYAPSIYYTEGMQGIIAGWGPGPFLFRGVTVDGVGLLLHFDDSSASNNPIPPPPGDYWIYRNRFVMPDRLRTNGVGTLGLRYMHRNGPEWKNGSRALLEGNVFINNWADVSSTGCAFVVTPIGTAAKSTDFTIRYNTVLDGSCFTLLIGGVQTSKSAPFERGYIHDNIISGSNGYTQFEAQVRGFSVSFPFYVGTAMGNLRVANNTVYNNRGPAPQAIHHIQQPVSQMDWYNNILWMNNDANYWNASPEFSAGFNPVCSGTAKTLFDCAWVGDTIPNYRFQNNLTVPYYTDSNTQTGIVSLATTATQYSGLSSYIITGATTPERLTNTGFTDTTTFRLRANSAYNSGGANPGLYGLQLGANVTALTAARGDVENVRALRQGSGSYRIYFAAPDSFGCPVDVSTNLGMTGYTRYTNLGGSRLQNVLVSAPGIGQTYYYRVMCEMSQPVGSFVSR